MRDIRRYGFTGIRLSAFGTKRSLSHADTRSVPVISSIKLVAFEAKRV